MTTRAFITRAGILAGILAGIIVVLGGPAGAAELPPIPVGERIPEKGHLEPGYRMGHTAPGSVHEVSSTPVDPANIGSTCEVTVAGANNESVHPNSDILVASANTVTIADVEREANVGTMPADGHLELGDTVTISVRLGADGLFSGGSLVVHLDCTPPPPPTTTTTPPTTTPPTTAPPAPTAPPTTVVKLGPPLKETRPCDNPEAPQTDTPADDCTMPRTGSSSGPLAATGGGLLAAGAALATRRRTTAG